MIKLELLAWGIFPCADWDCSEVRVAANVHKIHAYAKPPHTHAV